MNKEVIVIKLGGSIFEEKDTTLNDLAELHKQGRKIVVIHGGAAKISSWMDKMGIPIKIVNGERATTAESLEIVAAVLAGLMNKEICAALLDLGVKACGLSGVDGKTVIGEARGGMMGLMGEVATINTELIDILLDNGYMPVIAPLSINAQQKRTSDNERLLNINGDPLAGSLADALKAKHLIFLTDTLGVKDASGQCVSALNINEAAGFISNGVAQSGMVPKLKAAIVGVQNGVQTSIIDGRVPHAVIMQLNDENMGTIIKS